MNITYLSYTGMNEPLGQSQVVPYLDILARFAKVRVISFEKDLSDNGNFLFDRFRLNKIRWTRKKYHKSPRLLATLYDVATMMYELVRGREKNKIQYIHCRGYVTAMAAFLYSIFSSNAKYIFDMRAFWPDEMVSANMLEKKSVLYMMLKKLEGELIARSYAVIVLTNAACEYLESHDRFISNKFYVIPTCVDYSKFQQIGHVGNLNVSDRIIIGTIGTINSGWFLMEEFANFVATFKTFQPKMLVRIITHDEPDKIVNILLAHGLLMSDIQIYSVRSNDMPKEIVQYDAITMFFVSDFSKLGSAPTRFGESLAAGVPCVVNNGVGDLDRIVNDDGVGVVLNDFSDSEVKKSCKKLVGVINDKNTSDICKNTSKKYFDLSVASSVYNDIYNS